MSSSASGSASGGENPVPNTEAEHDPTTIIVANNPLPENTFPANVPPEPATRLDASSEPVVLRTIDELKAVLGSSRDVTSFSNFREVFSLQRSARTPTFPTFTRFSSTRFANAVIDDYKVVEGDSRRNGALFDMLYPIALMVTDGEKFPIPGLAREGVLDSRGYPLLYSSEEPRKLIRGRSSGALYPANLSRALNMRLSSYPDVPTIRTWTNMFQLSSEKDAQAILLQRVMGSRVGDNHIALLFKAYLAYFDSIVGALEGVKPSRNAFSSSGTVVNTATEASWATQLLGSGQEIVNVLGGSAAYQEFWAYCSFQQPPVFAAKISGGVMATSLFSHYKLGPGMGMVCLCDCEAYSTQRLPDFFGKPNLILGHIETYVQRYGLQHQANEALQIAMLWPSLCQVNAHVSLPKPHHAVDWFGGEVERSSAESPYSGLISSNPFVALASTLAGAWAMRAQIYDYITLLTTNRNTWELTQDAIDLSLAWLGTHVSAPGVGWDFLFRHQFHTTPSFLYLTGLSVEPVDWTRLVGAYAWTEANFPAHLRLIQPFWVRSSVCCRLPWQKPWRPELDVSGEYVTATPTTIMCLLRLGLFNDSPGDAASMPNLSGIFGILDRGAQDTARISAGCAHSDVTKIIRHQGVRVVALSAQAMLEQSAGRLDTSRSLQLSWPKHVPVSGLLHNVSILEMIPDALRAPISAHDPKSLSNPEAFDAAASRLEDVKRRIANDNQRIRESVRAKLSEKGMQSYRLCDKGYSSQTHQKILYSPGARQDGAWWCVLYLLRRKLRDYHSMACLLQSLKRHFGPGISAMPSLHPIEAAGLCATVDVGNVLVCSEGMYCLISQSAADGLAFPLLCLRGDSWEILSSNSPNWEACDSQGHAVLYSSRSLPSFQDATNPNMFLPGVRKQEAKELELPNLATRALAIDNAIRKWDIGVLDTPIVARLHEALFPNAWLPRFLTERNNLEARASNAEHHSNSDGSVKVCTNPISLFLVEKCGPHYRQTLMTALAFPEENIANENWPHRAPESARKNNLTILNLLHVLDCAVLQEALAVWFVWCHQGNHAEFVTAVALWLATLDICHLAWSELLASELLDCNEDTWLRCAKGLHDYWRKAGLKSCTCSSCWTQLLYTQSLWGRGGVTVEWEEEISNKAQVPDDILAFTGTAWSAQYASELIHCTVREVLDTASERVSILSFDHFMDTAYEWLVGGSAAGMPSAFKGSAVRSTLLREYKIHPRPTKRSVMEKIPREHVLQQLRTRPQTVAKLHQKLNETGGKARAIYGVTLWHYIFSNWLMAPFEKAIKHDCIDINMPNDHFLSNQIRRAQDARSGACFNSYDYPDFNSMHTHYHMSMIYEAAAEVARESQACSIMNETDFELVMDGFIWLRDSVFTQACYLPLADRFIQTVGGLYSGNRDTTLVNTLLNIAYAKVVDTSCSNMRINAGVLWRLCHGDDIITHHSSYGSALVWNVVAAKANLKGQESKLLTDRSYHEYLRVMGCPDGTLRGSLARVVATFVNGNWETDYTPGVYSKVVELMSTLNVLQRRGMRPAFREKLWKASLHRLMSLVSSTGKSSIRLRDLLCRLEDGDHEPISRSPPASVNAGRASNLSKDLKMDTDNESQQTYVESPRHEKLRLERLFEQMPDNITQPYINFIVSSLPLELQFQHGLQKRLKPILQRSTYGSEMPKRFQTETDQAALLSTLPGKFETEKVKRGKKVKEVSMESVAAVLGEHRVFAQTIRRVKSLHAVLSLMGQHNGYDKIQLIALLTNSDEAMVVDILLTQSLLVDDWRRQFRPSAAEVAALENELEILFIREKSIEGDEEVVLITDDGTGTWVPVRDLMLY